MNFNSFKLYLLLLPLIFWGCDNESDNLGFLNNAPVPSNLSAHFEVAQDNSGLVTITPLGDGANTFIIDFGDGSGTSDPIAAGESIPHAYDEGAYQLGITGTNVSGKSTDASIPLMVSFLPPENFMVDIQTNALEVSVSATADLEMFFEVTFGEQAEAEPIQFLEGETVSYTYQEIGDYVIEVRAYSGASNFVSFTDTISILNPLLLPIDFESTTLDYAFNDFEGAATSVIDNPDPSGLNTSSKVANSLKTEGAQTFAGTILELDEPIDFTEFQRFKVQVWSPEAGITVKMKIENENDPNIAYEVDVVNTTANAWKDLIFDFSPADLNQEYTKLIFFFDFGNTGTGADFYFDNIEQTNQGPVALGLPLDFESDELTYTFTNFGGANSMVIPNPDPSGINTSATVANLNKENGSEVWAGSFIDLDNPLDFTEFQQISIKTWSPMAGAVVRFKIENTADPNIFIELDATTTVANQWEELTYDLSGQDLNQEYSRVVVFFDFGNNGTGADYYFDDIAFTDGSEILQLPLTFESDSLTYTFTGFGNANASVIDNPDPTGINTSLKVGNLNKANGAEVWGGAFIDMEEPIDFSVLQKIRFKAWSPRAGIAVRLKLENLDDSNIFLELDANTTVANQWEELVYDFSGLDLQPEYQRLVFFFDFGTNGMGEDFYFDDVELSN